MSLSSENEEELSFEDYDKAARIIQKAWKNYLDICVFSHFRNLIYIRRQGDPHQLLKYIDPKEAELIDAASGINIRFRLGGEKFPPCIYYKIFTHRNIVDLCANSPRDYVNVIPKQLAHLPFFKNLEGDRRGWYQRVENNGWRLLSKRDVSATHRDVIPKPNTITENSIKVFHNIICQQFWRAGDEITEEGNRQKVSFSFSKLMRKQDYEKRRKYKKIQWMREMYYAGSLETKRADNRCTDLILKATKGLMRAVEQGGIKSVMEWEVDEILSWTNALNYEEYVNNWKSIGTSNSSANLQGFRFETIYNQAANQNYSPSAIEDKAKHGKLKKTMENS